jgi:hypothetical protein
MRCFLRAAPSRAEPSRAEPSRAVNESLIESHRSASLLPGNSNKYLDDARIRKGHVTALAATQQWKHFPACQIQGFIGVCSSSTVQFQMRRREWSNTFSSVLKSSRRELWNCYSCVLKAVAGKRLVEIENPSACATGVGKLCKSTIAAYCLYICVIKCEWVLTANKSHHPN